METTNILILTNMALLLIGVIIIIRYNKVRREKFLEMIIQQINLENMGLIDCFSKDVIEVYLDILKNPNGWLLNEYALSKISDGTMIWAANDVYNRIFYTHGDDEVKNVIEEKNKKLTYYDKVLLDKIVESYKNRQDKLVTKFFI